MRDSGLSDLLLAKLSSLDGVELVEREAFESLAAEYSLAELGSAGAARQRVQLGTFLRANRLLLLSRAALEDEASEVFQLVVADCQTGARLADEYYPGGTDPEQFAKAVAVAVEQTQSRFPGGVMRVVGVSHFLANTLVHSYDHRQAGYAYLLQRALALHPGTAVLEIEEARAVAQELALSTPPDGADSLRRRIVPILVDGEFTVSEDHAAGTHAVDLTVHVRRGSGVDEIRETALPPAEVVSFLTGELPRRILALEDDQAPLLSAQEQRDWLLARAERFARVGAWEHSLGLREAALLIDPHDVSIRLDLIHEYGLHMIKRLPTAASPELVPAEEEIRQVIRSRVESFLAGLAHLEFLIRNGLLSADEILAAGPTPGWIASCWASSLERCMPRRFSFGAHAYREAREAHALYRRVADEEFRVAREREGAFMIETFPRILSLTCTDCEGVQRRWADHRLSYHFGRLEPGIPSAETLDRLYQIAEEFPPGSGFCTRFVSVIVKYAYEDVKQQTARIKREKLDWSAAYDDGVLVEFLERLAEKEQPNAQIYGRWGLVQRRWILWQERWRSELDHLTQAKRSELGAELSLLAEEARQVRAFHESLDLPRSPADSFLSDLCEEIEKRLPTVTRPAGAASEYREWTPYAPGEEDNLPQIELAGPVEMAVKTLTGETNPMVHEAWQTLKERWGDAYPWPPQNRYPIVGWRKCDDDLDVLWNDWAVLVMRTKGVAEEVFSEAEPRFLNVNWDGRHLWIVTKHDGLRVITSTGEPVRRIAAAEGLPPYDQGLVLHPIEPGVVCIAGSFGDQRRGWCAIVDVREDQPVRIIHEATAVRPQTEDGGEVDPLSWAFRPTFAHELKDEESQRRILIIGRDVPINSAKPLVVDLDTLEVMVPPRDSVAHVPMHPRTPTPDFYLYSGKRRLLLPSCNGGTIPGLTEYTWGPFFKYEESQRRRLCERGGGCCTLLPLGEWVYMPTQRGYWYRIHRDTFEEQPLPLKSPKTWVDLRWHNIFRISAHYGIVVTYSRDAASHAPYRQLIVHEPKKKSGPR